MKYNDILSFLNSSCENGRLSHAYILSGDNDLELDKIALHITCLAMCTGFRKPCMDCDHCKKIGLNRHPDLKTVSSNDGKAISVDTIRNLNDDFHIRPNEADRKLFVIKQADKLTLSGQNALLKILEEPPENVIIILICSDSNILLPTVLSRCIKLSLYSEDNSISTAFAEAFIQDLMSDNEYIFLKRALKWSAVKNTDILISELNEINIYILKMLHQKEFTNKKAYGLINNTNVLITALKYNGNKKICILKYLKDCKEVIY